MLGVPFNERYRMCTMNAQILSHRVPKMKKPDFEEVLKLGK
jgi:hypothetical protein